MTLAFILIQRLTLKILSGFLQKPLQKKKMLYTLRIGPRIEKILGFEPSKKPTLFCVVTISLEKNILYHLLNLFRIQCMFTLVSVNNELLVMVEAQLLHVVPVDVESYSFSRIKHKNFSPLRYIPVLRKNVQTIEVDIRDHL